MTRNLYTASEITSLACFISAVALENNSAFKSTPASCSSIAKVVASKNVFLAKVATCCVELYKRFQQMAMCRQLVLIVTRLHAITFIESGWSKGSDVARCGPIRFASFRTVCPATSFHIVVRGREAGISTIRCSE